MGTSWMKEDKEDWKKFNDIECEKFLKNLKNGIKEKKCPLNILVIEQVVNEIYIVNLVQKTNIENRDCIGYALIKEGENSLLKINVCNHLNQCHRATLITNSNVIEKITNPIQMNNLIQFSLDLKQSKENRSILSKELGLGNSYYKRKFDRLTGTPFKKNKKKNKKKKI